MSHIQFLEHESDHLAVNFEALILLHKGLSLFVDLRAEFNRVINN